MHYAILYKSVPNLGRDSNADGTTNARIKKLPHLASDAWVIPKGTKKRLKFQPLNHLKLLQFLHCHNFAATISPLDGIASIGKIADVDVKLGGGACGNKTLFQ